MATDPNAQWPRASDEPTVAFHGTAAVAPDQPPIRPMAEYPTTAVPYQRPPRSAAIPILSTLLVIVTLALVGVAGYFVSATNAAHQRQDQLATQLAEEQRRVKELQAQVAAAKAEAERAKAEQAGGAGPGDGKVEQLTSCADALKGVLGARSGAEFAKAFEAMRDVCKVAGIPLF